MPRVLLAVLLGGCGTAARPADPPAAPPPPPPGGVVHGEPAWRVLTVCLADEGGVREVPVQYSLITGDTMVDGRPFSGAHPLTPAYAEGAGAEWYAYNHPIEVGGHTYVKYGIPRALRPEEVVPAGTYRGVLMFREAGDDNQPHPVYYLATRPGCEFQAYQWDLAVSDVRG